MPRVEVAKTFNCGIGYVAIVPPSEVQKVMDISAITSIDGESGCYIPMVLGKVEEGDAGTDFAPWGLHLPPPGSD
jgi:phosphoribosylaminoimidazole (AIR) synthetase